MKFIKNLLKIFKKPIKNRRNRVILIKREQEYVKPINLKLNDRRK